MRLAFQQGLLSQKSLNKFQRWAARYYMGMTRRREAKDNDDRLKLQAYYLNPDHYYRLFAPDILSEDDAEPEELPVDDLDEIDRYFANLDQTRMMTGGEVLAMADEEGWQ